MWRLKINLTGSLSIRTLRGEKSKTRWNNECLQPWWGCISASGVEDIAQIDGIMNAEIYRQVLIHYAIPSGKCLIGNGLEVFQDHNDPKHTAGQALSVPCRCCFSGHEVPHHNGSWAYGSVSAVVAGSWCSRSGTAEVRSRVPMERVGVDVLGPFPITESGNRYVLVAMDHFTKWPKVYVVPDQRSDDSQPPGGGDVRPLRSSCWAVQRQGAKIQVQVLAAVCKRWRC